MRHVHLGRTGLQVSRLCLGTMNFGVQTDEKEAFKIMDRAHEVGINFFDTADVYGWKQGEGITEQLVGRWFAQGGGRRERTVLATKVYGQMGDWPNERYLSALHIRRACEGSLKRLGVEYLDLYQMHHMWNDAPWDEIWQAMEQLVREGKVIYLGSSNFAGWKIAQANEQAMKRNTLGLVSEQSLYNLTERTVELEVIPACEEYGLGLIPWSPLAGGLLGGILKKENMGRRASENVQAELAKLRPQVEAYEALCDEIGERPADVALAWLLSNLAVTAPIIGPRTLVQFEESLKAVELTLTEDVLDRLDKIFPGPGTAPEAYAW